jgi:hypothetical protein
MGQFIPVHDGSDWPIGRFDVTGYSRLPAVINWQGRTFQRYGNVNRYRYVEEPVTIVDAATIMLD